jgi:hypothetical protein
MAKKSDNRFVQNVLMEMERVLSEYEPIYKRNLIDGYEPLYGKNISIGEDALYSKDFIIGYENGSFIIHFLFNACPILIAQIMRKLTLKFKVEVGEPFYISSGNQEVYWGCESHEKYFADLRTEFLREKSEVEGECHFIQTDNCLKN